MFGYPRGETVYDVLMGSRQCTRCMGRAEPGGKMRWSGSLANGLEDVSKHYDMMTVGQRTLHQVYRGSLQGGAIHPSPLAQAVGQATRLAPMSLDTTLSLGPLDTP